MRARWVSEQPQVQLPTVGRAIVASWCPRTYYWLSTVQLDSQSPVSRLTEAIRSDKPYEDVKAAPDSYVTSVYRCNHVGAIHGDPLYERTYLTFPKAQDGHREALQQMREGRWRQLRKSGLSNNE